ncbi:unnamed protein product [Thlaspi arvense]|uniref:F-box domain-containing protein n=1 Tax=Thlaspi arvense TaxID=13288 RepID=A0AAU9SH51_THLAR|nr:unnamed protein product [Thlaspi arvense]
MFIDANAPRISLDSLPDEILTEILVRVPNRMDPILSTVCKSFRRILASPHLRTLRRRLKKDTIFLMFVDLGQADLKREWFRIDENVPRSLVSTHLSVPRLPIRCTIAIDAEVFVICGSSLKIPVTVWVSDTRTGELSQVPDLPVELMFRGAGLVCNKIYLVGADHDKVLRAEDFDLTSRTWSPATPITQPQRDWRAAAANASIDKKSLLFEFHNTRLLRCEQWVMFGLMWYDSNTSQWKMVEGLSFNRANSVAMAEYNSMLAFIWTEESSSAGLKKIWFTLISLEKTEYGFHGSAQPFETIGTVPISWGMRLCLSVRR